MLVTPYDPFGKINIEVDIEIDDINDRTHRCIYYVKSDANSLKKFGENLTELYYSDIGTTISLH